MTKTPRSRLSAVLTVLVTIILVLVPISTLLTIWLASNFGHYTALRLWDEALVVLIALGVAYLVFRQRGLRQNLEHQRLVWLIKAYALLQLLLGVIAWLRHDVTAKALGYGLIVNLRFLLFFIVCWIVSSQSDWLKRHWRQLLLIPAALIVVFGLLQHFALPYDFLRHFGYSPATIRPYETINNNLHYVRLISTLRGANPLGAYLIIIVSALTVLLLRPSQKRWRWAYAALLLGSIIALFYSYSRGAWIGAALSVGVALTLSIKAPEKLRWLWYGIGILIVAIGLSLFALRNTRELQDTIFHTDQSYHAPTTSNQGHASALKSGLRDVLHEPLGEGPGTAGPESVYNNHPPRIAENYFVQVAQEVGWIGIVLFVLINAVVAKYLWRARRDSLALVLLAALVGITFVNLLSHAWVDDTLSYLWWGLAGITLARTLESSQREAKENDV